MEAADRGDSTAGVQMAYLISWAKRALKPIELRLPALLERENGRVQGRLADMTKKWANALMQVRELQASLDNRDRLRKEEHQAQVAEVASLRAELSGAKPPPPEQQQAAAEKKGGGCFGGLFSCFGGGPAVVSERQTRRPSWVERV